MLNNQDVRCLHACWSTIIHESADRQFVDSNCWGAKDKQEIFGSTPAICLSCVWQQRLLDNNLKWTFNFRLVFNFCFSLFGAISPSTTQYNISRKRKRGKFSRHAISCLYQLQRRVYSVQKRDTMQILIFFKYIFSFFANCEYVHENERKKKKTRTHEGVKEGSRQGKHKSWLFFSCAFLALVCCTIVHDVRAVCEEP